MSVACFISPESLFKNKSIILPNDKSLSIEEYIWSLLDLYSNEIEVPEWYGWDLNQPQSFYKSLASSYATTHGTEYLVDCYRAAYKGGQYFVNNDWEKLDPIMKSISTKLSKSAFTPNNIKTYSLTKQKTMLNPLSFVNVSTKNILPLGFMNDLNYLKKASYVIDEYGRLYFINEKYLRNATIVSSIPNCLTFFKKALYKYLTEISVSPINCIALEF